MDESRNVIAQLMNAYRSLPADRKIILAVCIIVFIGVFWLWLSSSGQARYALLYGDLNLKDSGTIVAELQSQNVPYKLTNNGHDILVPADQLLQLRIDIAKGDILPTSSTGFELFDKTNLGLTEFTQNINRQRALQGELERTLRAMDGVENARVLLNIPDPSPFMGDAEEANANVVVWLSPRLRTLNQGKVATIQNIVAASGVPPENVSVSDGKLNLLSKPPGDDDIYAAPDMLALKHNYEKHETEKIQKFLEKRFGPGKVTVGVSVELNFDRLEKESKTYIPIEGTTKGVLTKEEAEEEETKGAGSQGAQGVPGTSSNVPGYPAVEGGTYQSERSHETKEYNVSEMWEHTIIAPGDVKKMSVSVLIDGEEDDAAVIKDVEQLVLAATNLDTTRGDKIMVSIAPFDMSYVTELEAVMVEEAAAVKWSGIYKWIPSAVVFLIALVIFMRIMKPIKEGYRVPKVDELAEEEEIEMPPQDPEAVRKVKMREEITRLAEQDPASAARIIKTWLNQ